MYLRTVRAKGAEGVEFEYIRLVEAHWENGRSKQRVIANLGRKDLLAPHLESLIKLLGGGKRTKGSSATCAERIEATLAACWGPMLVARWLWARTGSGEHSGWVGAKNKPCAKGRQTPFCRSSAGVGGQSSLPSVQRARIGAMAGERFCLGT